MKESCDINCDSNDSGKLCTWENEITCELLFHTRAHIFFCMLERNYNVNHLLDRVLLQRRSTSRKSSKRNPTFFHTNVRNEDATRDDYMCYRCQHFLEIPRNLSRPFVSNRMSTGFVERCKEELSFVQAIICLKSVSASVSQISVEQLQQIFDRQWDTRGERHCEDNDIEQSPVNKGLISERTPMRDTFTTSTPLSISDTPYITPQRTVSYTTRFEDTRGKLLSSTSTNNPNQSAVESLLILESSNSCRIAAREKKKEVESCIIPETDVESILNESLDMFDSMPEHQCFEFEKDTERSVRSASKSGIEQINKKIIESKQKSYADIPNEGKTILPPRNQFIDSMIDSENNFIDFISMKSQNLTDRVLDRQQSADCSPKSLIITQKDISQMSNVNNDEYFEFLFDDNNPWQMSNTTTGNPHEDSAYSTSRNDIFNNDTAVEAGLIAGNKRLSDTEHYCKLQPCKKKAIVDETGKVSSSINGMSTSAGNSKSLITGKDISQISDVNDENVEFQIVNSYDGWMSDIISEDSEDDVAVAAESFGDKCTPNIEHCYDLHNSPCNEKTITREKMMTSASIIQGTVISDNIEHHYNLRVNNRRISREKEVSSTIIGSKERKSRRTWRLLEKENENENKMISADWLNFTLDSLHIEHVIIKSLKVILSTFCDKKMVEEYMIREQLRNTRNYWKGSLEEEAVNAILNISDIFTTEKKPNICIKVIMIAITTALNEMMRAQLNKMYYTEVYIT